MQAKGLHLYKKRNLKSLPHILFVCSWYPHQENITHGVFIKRHAECIALNHRVTVIFVKSSAEVIENTISINETGNLIEIIILYPKIKNNIIFFKEYLKFKAYNNAILKALQLAQQQHAIDIVHLQVIFPACIPTLQILKRTQLPLVITEHWTGYAPEDDSYKGFLKTHYTKKIIAKAKVVVTISSYLKKIMEQQGLQANYQIIPNSINTDVFCPHDKTVGDVIKFIHISSLDDAQKNVSGIIKSFKNAHQKNNNMQLTIVGEGDNKSEFMQLAEKLNISKYVFFVGRLSETELAHEINNHHALVMFSNYETFCLAIVETLACGKPVITTNVGGIVEYMNSKLGITVEPKNETKLTEALLTFIANKNQYNAQTIRNFVVTHFDKNKINQQFTDLYKKVLKN